MIWGYRLVHCVPVRISPVTVRLHYMRIRQFVLGMMLPAFAKG
jgi:hypothetical protein